MKVVGVDPGTHTGCVVWTDEAVTTDTAGVLRVRRGPKAQYGQVLEAHEFTGTKEDFDRWGFSGVGVGVGGAWNAEDWRVRETLCALSVYSVCLEYQPELIVVEDFVLRGGQTHNPVRSGLSPDRVQAMLHALLLVDAAGSGGSGGSGGSAGVLGVGQIMWLSASMAKTTITDERLKYMGLYVKGKPHARDALRHAITGYRKVRGAGTW